MSDKRRIIYTRPDGGVSVVVPAPGATDEDVLKAVPHGVPYDVVSVDDIPADRTFRDAWEKSGKQCVPNLAKAKEICHCRRRDKRAAEFAPLDVEATIPAKAAQAEAKRQAVRDKHAAIQAEIDACTCCDDLKAVLEREGL